jgi:hypothetical protein
MSKPVAVLAKNRSTRKVLVGATTIGIDPRILNNFHVLLLA